MIKQTVSSTFLFIFVFFYGVQCHPSYGITITANGDLIFCDVLHNEGTLWKFSKKDGLIPLLAGEHCHFIYLDQNEYIWGTNHEYLPATDGNRNTLWKIKPGSNKEIIISPTEDPRMFSGVNFVVNSKGTIIYNYQGRLFRRGPGTGPVLYVSSLFGRIISLQMDRDDNLYVVDNNENLGSVFKITPAGNTCTLADQLLEEHPEDPPFDNPMHNMLYAVFVDDDGQVYVANSGSRRITLIDANYEKHHIYKSEAPWYPVAYIARGENAYVMEMGYISGVGNIGPRIVSLEKGIASVVVNVD
jgi:DNA-binding beta-propeller fold protein YncE